jgi:hypothetical protein
MAEDWLIDLYELLPSFYKLKDAEQNYRLRSLLNIVSEQANLLKNDIDGLWDDLFIETCSDWVVPYIADLVGTNILYQTGISGKADVAKTIYYRRRKGTLSMLEELARDVTGWGAHAVAFMELLGWTQTLNHLRFKESSDPRMINPQSFDNVGTVNLRSRDTLDLLDGPFDVISDSVDIRNISRIVGWYGIKKLGFFLWRLNSYPAGTVGRQEKELKDDLIRPRGSTSCSYGYYFNVLGIPSPLFNNPEAETDEARLASEMNIPGPIRALSFQLRPGDYYGSDKSFFIVKGGIPVPLAAISPQDLTHWKRPPAAGSNIKGLLSGDVSPFAGLTHPNPVIGIIVGSGSEYKLSLLSKPVNLEEARASLELAIQRADDICTFSDAIVLIAGKSLLILPGTPQDELSFTSTSSDTTTIQELGLDSAAAQPCEGTLSGELEPFPELTSSEPEMNLELGDTDPIRLVLKSRPNSLNEARLLLEAAIRDALQGTELYPLSVVILGDRLLVLAGGMAVSFSETDVDNTTFLELALGGKKVAVDMRLGRISFAKGDEPQGGEIGVYYNYGFSADLGGGPYERRMTIESPDPSEVEAGKCYIAESSANDLQGALDDWDMSVRPKGLITITDNETCEDHITIKIKEGRSLVIQAANQRLPSLRPPEPGLIDVEGAEEGSLSLNGLLIEGGLHIKGNLDELKLQHCTLVPGRRLGEDGLAVLPEKPSILAEDTSSRLSLIIDHSICGALRLPVEMDCLEVYDSIVDCASKSKVTSSLVSALVSGIVESLSDLGVLPLDIEVTVGMEGPFKVSLGSTPSDLEDAAYLLEEAIKETIDSQGNGESFAAVKVVAAGNRLILLSEGGRIIIEPSGSDTTAEVLRLTSETSSKVQALLSDELPLNITLSNSSPSMKAIMGSWPEELILDLSDPYPRSLQDVGNSLQSALRTFEEEAFKGAIVATVDNRLVVIPGAEGVSVFLGPTEDDKTTIMELGLQGEWPAISSTNDTFQPGPRTCLERTTVFGSIRVKELDSASECIITGKAMVDRRQTGCVRFSYISDGSRTPRRYHCQPDLALVKLEEEWSGHPDSPSKEDRQRAIDAVLPAFTSMHYGQPAYAQLSQNCAEEIRKGAEDGSEMGAFCSLKQPQREDNLRIRLEEYMPFGLDGGFIFIT